MIVVPQDEQDRLVAELSLGPLVVDGVLECRVCGDRRPTRQASAMHTYRAHFRKQLDREHRLALPGFEPCPDCDEIITGIGLTKHRRERHGVGSGRRRGRPPKEVGAEVVKKPPINGRKAQPLPTPTEAGLAILAGLAPGGEVPVERLHDVVEWLRSTEELVNMIRR